MNVIKHAGRPALATAQVLVKEVVCRDALVVVLVPALVPQKVIASRAKVNARLPAQADARVVVILVARTLVNLVVQAHVRVDALQVVIQPAKIIVKQVVKAHVRQPAKVYVKEGVKDHVLEVVAEHAEVIAKTPAKAIVRAHV